MKLRSLLLASLTTLLGCFGCATSPSYPTLPSFLSVDYDIAQMMWRIQSEYEEETVFCLGGYVHADTIFVNSIHPARLTERNTYSVRFERCHFPTTIGLYHNHPPSTTDDGLLVYYCALSDADVNTLRRIPNAWISMITCNNERQLVWRYKHADHDEYLQPIQPSSDQETGDL